MDLLHKHTCGNKRKKIEFSYSNSSKVDHLLLPRYALRNPPVLNVFPASMHSTKILKTDNCHGVSTGDKYLGIR